jgi:hypothetical protein
MTVAGSRLARLTMAAALPCLRRERAVHTHTHKLAAVRRHTGRHSGRMRYYNALYFWMWCDMARAAGQTLNARVPVDRSVCVSNSVGGRTAGASFMLACRFFSGGPKTTRRIGRAKGRRRPGGVGLAADWRQQANSSGSNSV